MMESLHSIHDYEIKTRSLFYDCRTSFQKYLGISQRPRNAMPVVTSKLQLVQCDL